MPPAPYLTQPVDTAKMPPGIPFIVVNEAAERFCYYGVNGILVVFMTHHLRDAQGQPAVMHQEQAEAAYHWFVSCVYFLPVLGAFLADAVLGKYRTILLLSLVYCLGNLALSLDVTRSGLAVGLVLIALGSGGIKPCVSANVGDQFGAANERLLPRVFTWFYFAINIGSALATIAIPEVLERWGARWAFGLPGIFMALATFIFWLGRRRYVHVAPVGLGPLFAELARGENLKALGRLLILVPFAAMFWALWQQNFSSWVLQSEKMNRVVGGHEWLPAQIQTVNPVFVLLMLPLMAYVIYPAVGRIVRLTPLRKFGAGLFAVILAFVIVGWIQTRIDAGERPPIGWQVLAFVVLTAGEVLVSVTHLEFFYTQAPKALKSLVMCLYLGSIALGNVFTATVNVFIQNPDGTAKLTGARYFFFFVWVMLGTALLFLVISPFYGGRTSAAASKQV